MQVHVAIVSEQLLANVIPVLMARPARLYLACSTEMAERGYARRLARFLERRGVETLIVEDVPAAGLQSIRESALDLLTRVQSENAGGEIVLNATGGNKLMALGFVEAFRDAAAAILYADTQHRRIEFLPARDGESRSDEPMRDVLDVPSYLSVQGFELAAARSDDPACVSRLARRKDAAKHFGVHARALGSFIGTLNALAQAATGGCADLVAPCQAFRDLRSQNWREALGLLARKEIIKWAGERDIEFLDTDAVRFCAGGWLEEYAWHVISDERPFDARLGVTGAWEHGRAARNEFDVLATSGNQLLFVECKTLRHGRDAGADSDLLYKLDSLGRDARGLYGSSWLLAAREPTEEMRDRANAQRIRIIGPSELPWLRDIVRDWLRGPAAG
ncbi:MAG: DUF1887 family protein [Burkholderiales bacterium]|nr:DUF1887 family protein [Burkholderiales bacterium]